MLSKIFSVAVLAIASLSQASPFPQVDYYHPNWCGSLTPAEMHQLNDASGHLFGRKCKIYCNKRSYEALVKVCGVIHRGIDLNVVQEILGEDADVRGLVERCSTVQTPESTNGNLLDGVRPLLETTGSLLLGGGLI